MRNETTFRMVLVTSVAVIGLVLTLGAYLELGWGMWIIPASLVVFPSTAYIAYDVRGVASGIHRAFKATVEWRLDKQHFRIAAWSALAFATLVFSLFFFLIGGVVIVTSPPELQSPYLVVISIAGAIGIFSFLFALVLEYFSKNTVPIERARYIVKRGNPVSLIVLAVYYCIPRGIPFVVMSLPPAISAVKTFSVQAFYNMHSEGRKAVFADTAMCMLCGFLIGIPLGSVFAGALTGLVIGPVLGYFGHRWTLSAQTNA